MNNLLELIIASILSHNIALVYILGMCPLIAISTNVKNAKGMGMAVVFVVTITAMINWPIYQLLQTTGTANLNLLIFIITIAATVQFLEMILEKFFPKLYNAFGIYLPLITVNCAVLAISLFFVNRDYNFVETTAFAFGSAVGWLVAIVLLAGIREKMSRNSDVPRGLAGKGIVFIILGIVALAFIGFSGLANI
ncbi:Rnf-Nqr domain containing protein [Peloplasma aerotolerans]|jgi:Na+-transporting NADH:ubiquinone oxidoreductase subunit E|uniref:Rnf-Nqr domain containing protein n=1 Tax=Peloplasma aerotolerans TaxID=3044389 RepID=A0AAW6UD00_9MOLU|nr:Rnf-Nqr domain containing protein [Mariniplasma sp. M4Ah]MDI6453361.1 Rnf-Nqr domain containing protein [Mariniplasma sp. M4Ah]